MNNQVTDYVIGVTGFTFPLWLNWLNIVSSVAVDLTAVGGLLLVIIRIALAVREWINK